MRKTLLLFMLLSVKLTFGQVSDDFTDGNFTVNPTWSGDASKFYVNSFKQLQSSLSTVAQSVILTTANFLTTNVKWEFSVQMNFDPSASNKMRIYLISDQENLNGSLNGYFVQIGESGTTDSYDLYRQTGTTVTKIIDRFDYNDSMHLALLKNVKGVSLERVSFLKPANDFGNFKSAAQSAGFCNA